MFKILVLLVFSEFVIRGCTPEPTSVCSDSSINQMLNSENGKLVADIKNNCKTCTKDLCNSGYILKASVFGILLTAFVSLVNKIR